MVDKVKARNMGRVLLQCGDHLENQQRILPLAKLLKSRGYAPCVLVYSRHKGHKFLESGIDVIAYNEFLSRNKRKKFDVDAGNWRKNVFLDIRLNDILEIESRRQPRLIWPSQVEKTVQNLCAHVQSLISLIDFVQPCSVGVWNGYTGFVANVLRVVSAARSLPAFFMERGVVPGSIFIDPVGVNGGSSLRYVDETELRNAPFKAADMALVEAAIAPWMQEHSAVDDIRARFPGKKIVFFPLQVQRDTNILLYSPVRTMREVVLAILRDLQESDETVLVVRPHPEEDAGTVLNLPMSDRIYIDRDGNLNDWIRAADVVLTINSTVGLEALFNGKAVIVLGESIYSGKGMTRDTSVKDLRADLLNPSLPDRELVCRYMSRLLMSSLILENLSNVVDGTFEWLGHGRDSLCSSERGDLNRFGLSVKSHEARLADVIENARRVASRARGVLVHVLFGPEEKLDLTYRRTAVTVTREWIERSIRRVLKLDDTVPILVARERRIVEDCCYVAMVREESRYRKAMKGYVLTVDSHGAVVGD